MHILLLEDEAAIREAQAAYLRRAGFEVAEYADGLAALQALADRRFDAFILDINVPSIDGLEACRRIRQHSLAPIMLVTARSSDPDELAGLTCGADDYVRKPFNPDILVARVQALLRRHGEKALSVGGLTIDPATQSMCRDGRDIYLTAMQFKILYLLAATPGKVYSRGEIVDRTYSDPFDCAVLERTIDAHIKRLRKLVEDNPAAPRYILTAVGRGYRFMGGHA